MNDKLKKAEEQTDNVLRRVADMPHSAIMVTVVLIATHALAMWLGAFLFGG